MAWVIDPAHTTVGFSARHMGLSTVRGRFTSFAGAIDLDPQDASTARGSIEVDMDSVDTGNADRDTHLRSGDFFDIETYPRMTFVLKSVEPDGDDLYRVHGDLTIKDVTREVTLRYEHSGEGKDPWGNRRLGGTLSGTIKRSDWDLKWNVALESGGWLVSDKIKIEVDGQLTESAEATEETAEAQSRVPA